MRASLTSMIVMSAAFGAGAARAEIVSAGPSGFNLRHVADAPNVAPPIIWAALADVAKWWDPEHTYSGDARNLSLEPFVRGCFCEKLGLYAGIEHGSVVYAMPAKTLRIQGSLGPLQEFGTNGVMTWQIEPAAGGSRITFTYSVGGFADRPLADWAPIVDEVLAEQLQRLARYVTVGNPDAPKTATEPPKQ
ncbi:MAG TPA: SRPBCC family protein [Steroidobacter sp.]|uniref:SRPBCC family protein n=1 Tax=Steroidobacter sp. TaxID=1978227 RepID=UPI002EDA3169